MAFARSGLERLAGGIKKLWYYDGAADVVATIQGSGYFNAIADEVDAGDVIICVGNNKGTIDMAVVTSARSVTPVTVSGVEGVTVS